MIDFKTARMTMVDCQIHPSGVVTAGILNAFGSIPREKFVPANMRPVAYADEALPLGQGRFLLGPAVHARMIQAAEPLPTDVTLDIGGGPGYSAAILSSLTRRVVALEQAAFLAQAQGLWREMGLENVEAVAGDLTKGYPGGGPYDLIFLNGAVAEIPEAIASQLSPGGRLVAILQKEGEAIGKASLTRRSGSTAFAIYPLFETGGSYLAGFAPKTAFQF